MTAGATHDPTVLIVDDDVILARAFALALTRDGLRAHTVHTAADALSFVKSSPPDVIILDFKMPLINGVGLLYRLRSQIESRNIPVLVVTGESFLSDEARRSFEELHAEVRLKPLELEELLSSTRALLSAGRIADNHAGAASSTI